MRFESVTIAAGEITAPTVFGGPAFRSRPRLYGEIDPLLRGHLYLANTDEGLRRWRGMPSVDRGASFGVKTPGTKYRFVGCI